VIVALGGTFFIIFLLIRMIKRINNPPVKNKPVDENINKLS